jgi:hypothetical protein
MLGEMLPYVPAMQYFSGDVVSFSTSLQGLSFVLLVVGIGLLEAFLVQGLLV